MLRALKWIVGVPLIILVSLAILGSVLPNSPPKTTNVPPTQLQKLVDERQEVMNNLRINQLRANKSSGGLVRISGEIANSSDKRLKDFEVTCDTFGASESLISTKKVTIYEVVSAKGSTKFKDISLGFVDQQAKSYSCKISWFWFTD